MAWHDMKKQLEKNRRPEDVLAARQANTLSRALFPVGMSSLGAAKVDERALMEETLASVGAIISRLRENASKSEVMEHSLDRLADQIQEAMEDNGVSKTFWEAQIGAMR